MVLFLFHCVYVYTMCRHPWKSVEVLDTLELQVVCEP